MRIGPHELRNNLFVAPMAGVTDRPFRQLCKKFGAAMAVSEMVASNSLLWGSEKTRRRANHEGEPDPISVQIAGADPAHDGRCRPLQRRRGRADHRHQHGLSGKKDLQRDGRLRAAERRTAGRAHPRCRGQSGGRAGDAQDSHRLGPEPQERTERRAHCRGKRHPAALDPRAHARLRLHRSGGVRHHRRGQTRQRACRWSPTATSPRQKKPGTCSTTPRPTAL